MNITRFLKTLQETPESIQFSDTMAVIEQHYNYTPSAFQNGDTHNEAGENEGSCKLFSFSKIQNLSEIQTLACFGDYYRQDVLKNPEGNDHANIRNFMNTGWRGISFDLVPEKILSDKINS